MKTDKGYEKLTQEELRDAWVSKFSGVALYKDTGTKEFWLEDRFGKCTIEFTGEFISDYIKKVYRGDALFTKKIFKNYELYRAISYYADGAIFSDAFYKNDDNHGPVTFYDNQGNVTSRENSKNGKKHGICYYSDMTSSFCVCEKTIGCRFNDRQYRYGKPDYCEIFEQKESVLKCRSKSITKERFWGKPRVEPTCIREDKTFKSGGTRQNWKNGQLHGLYQEFWDNGKLLCEIYFKKDQMDGPMREWDRDGNLRVDTCYKKGKLHGWHHEYEDGKLKIKRKFKSGCALLEKLPKRKSESKSASKKSRREHAKTEEKYWGKLMQRKSWRKQKERELERRSRGYHARKALLKRLREQRIARLKSEE